MRIDLDYTLVNVMLRPQTRVHVSVRMRVHPPGWGVDLWLMEDGSVQVQGVGTRLMNDRREYIRRFFGPELLVLGQLGAGYARTLDAAAANAGLALPFRVIQSSGRRLPDGLSHLELGGVGAGVCDFHLLPDGSVSLRVPIRAEAAPGRPLAPITRIAQERWDRTWAPGPAAHINATLGPLAASALDGFRTTIARLPASIDL